MIRLKYQVFKNPCFPSMVRYFSENVCNELINVDSRMSFKTSGVILKHKTEDSDVNKTENKKKNLFITLIGVDGKLSTSTLEAATKLSKRRDLKLIKVSDLDVKKQNPLYRLLSNTQVLAEDIERKKSKANTKSGYKSEKIISFSCKISDHDLTSKVQKILKWVAKKHEVRATISGSPENSLAESVYCRIEKELENKVRILQKRNSGSDIKFVIIPLKEEKSKEEAVKDENKR